MPKKTKNPYLAHLSPSQRGAGSDDIRDADKKEPLFGFLPRKVTANQVRQALEHDVNPFTKVPHTPQYKKILEARKKLPVYSQMEEFYKMFNNNQITIVIGETGSGKTTQIPQFAVYSDLPHTKGKMVCCTQPRRVAVMPVAKRVADEMDVQLGRQVGYSTRFEDMTESGTTCLRYMTDDALLREVMDDHDLNRYSTIILDETHERGLATDVLMALLKSLARRRSDLKIVVMSATLDAMKFQKYFKTNKGPTAPLLKVSARQYPVEVFYTMEPEPDYLDAAIRTVLMIHRSEEPGDILLFLNGGEEIECACRQIKLEADDLANHDPNALGPLVCIPLYASLPPQQLQGVLDPSPLPSAPIPGGPPGRKVVVSTNIAESSLTIDGIVYVIDPGFSERRVYNPRIRVESLLVCPISKAAARQRTLCAGRTRPGKCFRLYTDKDFMSELEEETCPEILSGNLANTVLVLVKAGVKDLVRFDWVDAPAPETLMRALELLNYLAALDDDGNLTALGSTMAEFPLDPQMSKTLLSSTEFHCSHEILTIAAMLSVRHVWVRPVHQRKEADAARALLRVPGGDHLTLLNVYNSYMQHTSDRNWAHDHYLSAQALTEVQNVRQQLEHIMARVGVPLLSTVDERERSINVKKALCCGFFMEAAHKTGTMGDYLILRDNQVVGLHPSSALDGQSEWVIFNKFMLTTRPYIGTVTDVQPEWLLEYACPDYFDLKRFPDGEAKRVLKRVVDKKPGKFGPKVGSETKKRKKQRQKKKGTERQ